MTEVAVQRRPRNRKQLIVAAAAKQFERRGFHDAAIADIAADVGITGPALYRHFRGKQNLLAAAVEFEIEGLEAAYAAPQPGLRDLLEYAAGKSLGQNRASALWERNQAYLDPTVGASCATAIRRRSPRCVRRYRPQGPVSTDRRWNCWWEAPMRC